MSLFGTKLKEPVLISISKELQECQKELNGIRRGYEINKASDIENSPNHSVREVLVKAYRRMREREIKKLEDIITAKLNLLKSENETII